MVPHSRHPLTQARPCLGIAPLARPHLVWSQMQISSSTRPLSLPPHPGTLPAGSVQHLDVVVNWKHAEGMKLLQRYARL